MAKNQHSQQNLSMLVLGTGGTIAGLGGDVYVAGQLGVASLLPASRHQIKAEQICQIDSKDMSFDIWQQLHKRVTEAFNDECLDAVVITHGTDTLEETAYFLYRTLRASKPVILTGAMRPADSLEADGPGNLLSALDAAARLASDQKDGVWVVFAGQIFSGGSLQKVHPTKTDAFASTQDTETEALAQPLEPIVAINLPVKRWPRVDIVMNYAGASGALVDALVAQRVDGIMVAGTGNGTLSKALEAALHMAREAGIAVGLTTRCLQGSVLINSTHKLPVYKLSPPQARIELMLELLLRHAECREPSEALRGIT